MLPSGRLAEAALDVVRNYNFAAETDRPADDRRLASIRMKIQGSLYRNQGVLSYGKYLHDHS